MGCSSSAGFDWPFVWLGEVRENGPLTHRLMVFYWVWVVPSQHGFTYIRGWMQMVLAPNDLFSWNNKAMSTMLLGIFTRFLLVGCARYSVHARILKPWRGRLPSVFSSYHVFSPPLSELNWRSLTPPGGPVPSPQKWRPFPQGHAHSLTRVQNMSDHTVCRVRLG